MKRLFDIFMSFWAIWVLIPLFIFVGILIKLTSKGPVFFKQERSGKDRKTFIIYKFRTMTTEAPKEMPTAQLEDAHSYITKLGSFLRKTSIDELPQLFNILKGDMSIVGPRPLLCSETDVLDAREFFNATQLRPGLTGLAQISGRDIIEPEMKAKLDGEYLSSMSFFYDLKIIFKTVFYVLGRKGIQEGKNDK